MANQKRSTFNDLVEKYENILKKMLLQDPQPPSNVNVLMHAFGHFSHDLTSPEKSFFLESLEKYRQGRVPLLVNQNLLKSWIIRFNKEYLGDQTFFEPYPEELMEITFI
nr:YbgA family protein [Methanobacterium formicicum]